MKLAPMFKNLKSGILRFKNGILYLIYKCDPRITVMLGLTYNCPCSCLHCGMKSYETNGKNELTKEEILKIIGCLPLWKIKTVYFFGGEPLMRKDVFELINLARKRRFLTCLDTNGYFLTKEMVKRLKEAGLNLIRVSIDSACPDIHNELRGIKNLFERAVEGIKYCRQFGLKCNLSLYATKENIRSGDLQKIIRLGEKMGVNFIRILPPIMIGKWLEADNIKLDYSEKRQLRKLRRFGFVRLEGDSCLSWQKKLFFISPFGEIQPCCYVPFNFGNVRDEPLEKILERMWRHPMFKIKINDCPMNDEKFRKEFLNSKSSIQFPIKFYKDEN